MHNLYLLWLMFSTWWLVLELELGFGNLFMRICLNILWEINNSQQS
jgi:hypothetical protein